MNILKRHKGQRLAVCGSFFLYTLLINKRVFSESGVPNALGIEAASFWRRKLETKTEAGGGKRYSGKPDGVAGTPK